MNRTKYTFTYGQDEERKFNNILGRLEPEDYDIVDRRKLVDETEARYSDVQSIIEMDPESALTFRLGMKNVKIQREKTEEELAEERAFEERNTVRVTVAVNDLNDPNATP